MNFQCCCYTLDNPVLGSIALKTPLLCPSTCDACIYKAVLFDLHNQEPRWAEALSRRTHPDSHPLSILSQYLILGGVAGSSEGTQKHGLSPHSLRPSIKRPLIPRSSLWNPRRQNDPAPKLHSKLIALTPRNVLFYVLHAHRDHNSDKHLHAHAIPHTVLSVSRILIPLIVTMNQLGVFCDYPHFTMRKLRPSMAEGLTGLHNQ